MPRIRALLSKLLPRHDAKPSSAGQAEIKASRRTTRSQHQALPRPEIDTSLVKASKENEVIAGPKYCPSRLWVGNHVHAHDFIVQPHLSELLSFVEAQKCGICILLANIIRHFYQERQNIIKSVHVGTYLHAGLECRINLIGQHASESIEVFVPKNSAIASAALDNYTLLVRRIDQGDTSSTDSLKWARHWLDTCSKQHLKCASRSESWLPTRLLDVSPNQGIVQGNAVRLVDGKCLSACSYAALSHCWGKVVPNCILTTSNIDKHKQQIEFDSLPKTFQDAVNFTRALDIRYLWIDSLCIVQNDEVDWRHESALMGQVYGNSLVTLAAVHAQSCHDGLFAKIPPHFVPYAVPQIYHEGLLLEVYARRCLPSDVHEWPIGDDYPLFARAWTYQERLMAPRVIYFTDKELHWACFECQGCECDEDPPSDDLHKWSSPKLKHENSLNRALMDQRWLQVVEEYSHLKLTNTKDKLPAISAIAKQLQQYREDDRYLAGLWYHTLLHELHWTRAEWGPPTLLRSKTYIAPTWSWASIKSGVCYEFRVDFGWKGDVERPKVLSAQCQTREDDTYGQVISGSLVILGRIVEASLSISELKVTFEHPMVGSVQFQPGLDSEETFRYHQDCALEPDDSILEDSPNTKTVYLLQIMGHKTSMDCLVLVKVHDRDVYNRIGMTEIRLLHSISKGEFEVDKQTLDNLAHIFSSILETEVTIE